MNFSVPSYFRKLIVKKLCTNFREATEIIQENLTRPLSNEVLIKTKYIGVNASDVNASAGRYFNESRNVPFEIGFEGIGEIVDIGDKVTEISYGKPVMFMKMGAFSEYVYVPENEVIPIASCNVNLLPLLISGSTAALSLNKCGQIVPGEKVLITAAAGGAGHIAVQWAKNAGCHVIGLCSSNEKLKFLQNIGCDRPINYKEESLSDVLQKEYPKGVNVVWETVGGDLYKLLFKNLAVKGRMVIVGATSSYSESSLNQDTVQNTEIKLMLRSSSINGFFLPHYKNDIPHFLSLLIGLMHEQKLSLHVDNGNSTGKEFIGLEDIARAVEYLYSRNSIGKVVVSL